MPREITPRPADMPTPPTVVRQHIDRVLIEAAVDPVSLNIDTTKVFLTFDVVEIQSDGTDGGRARYTYPLADWPTGIRQDIVALRNRLLSAAETLGLIEAGTDSGEIDSGSSP